MERGNSSAESVEKLLHLLDPEPRSPRHIDHREAVEDAAIIAALPADALRFREQANLLVIPNCGSSQTCPPRHFANRHVRHTEKSFDLKCTLSASLAMNLDNEDTEMKKTKPTTLPLPLIVKIAIAITAVNTWVIFEEVVVDRHGLWRYMPFYRVGLFCSWDASVLTIILLVVLMSVAPLRSAVLRMFRKARNPLLKTKTNG